MKADVKTFLVLLYAFVAVFSLSADELDTYITALDRAERNFWSAAFASPSSSIRKNYKESLNKLNQSARKIQDWRRKNDSRINYGDLMRPGILLEGLLSTHSAFKERLNVNGLHPTTLDEVRKILRKNGFNSRQKTITENDISLADYKKTLESIRDENLEALTKKFSSGSNLKHFQQDVLIQTAQKFYTIITDARLTSFKLRKNDPLFQRQNRFGNNRK